MEMEKTYDPALFEDKLYSTWMEKGYFTPKIDPKKDPYTIVIPPPNITGQLHMGHALNNTLQDIMVRFKRMQGHPTLWLPGTDHASIATEVKIVDKLKAEGKSKEELGREGFLEAAWAWKKQYGGRIVEQLKRLGSSLDWTREAFTMDEKCNRAVKKVFVNLYNKGLIYRGSRIINWCPCCKTALSDAEVEYSEQDSFLWHIKYPLTDGSGFLTVATTRPETMFGDTAVAVNPSDERYASIIGKTLSLPLTDRVIPIVADEYVEKDFGSGAVKITPAHDPNDFEVGMRHNLEIIRVMNDDGTMNEKAGAAYCGLDRFAARKKVEEDLAALGLLIEKEPYKHNVGECYRCHSSVEPIISKQWFVKMKPLAEPAIKVVKEGDIEFIPERFSKVYFGWMENIKDWCISRQLWWGHRIPAYYCEECGETVVAENTPERCPKCGCTHFKQDEDVLDTWFSSALWPFSTLGYPEKTEDLKYFYPTSVLITAYDIIFFWVARMIFSGLEHMGQIPFSKVMIHGIVRDKLGRKMSKSLGNGIDPLLIIDKYGADSLRFSLANGIAPGGDTRFYEEKVESARNFINKVWNASRFVMMNLEGVDLLPIEKTSKTIADRWILSRLQETAKAINENLEKYEIGLAGAKLYDFVWSEFCDWYIEAIKPSLYSEDATVKQNAASNIYYVLVNILKMLHPYIPFVTEHIYLSLPVHEETIMLSAYPTYNADLFFEKEKAEFEAVMDVIKGIRNIRAEMAVAPSKRIHITAKTQNEDLIRSGEVYLAKLAGVEKVTYDAAYVPGKKVSTVVTAAAEIFIPLGDLIDYDKEIERLQKEKASLEKEIAKSKRMLGNPGFVSRAPEAVVSAERDRLAVNEEKLQKIIANIQALAE